MEKLIVNANTSYEVYVENDLLNNLKSYVDSIPEYEKVLIITDDNVKSFYLDKVLSQFSLETTISHTIKAGDSSKSLKEVEKIEELLLSNNFSRNDLVIALGGGVISDLSGYCASIYKRGIRYINVPTTLLSMVDASIGGKTGINTNYGKNLIGTFYNPSLVLIDPTTLKTLEKDTLFEGIGEIVKYACIKDESLLSLLEDFDNNIETIIIKCLKIKSELIEIDPYDRNERMLLNYGHSIAHSIEHLSNYSIPHGLAVMKAIIYFTTCLEQDGICKESSAQKIKCICDKFGIDYDINFSIDDIIDVITNDKKSTQNKIKEIFIERIGCSYIKSVSFDELKNLLAPVNK